MSRSFRWPTYATPGWLAIYAAGAAAWLGLYALGGWTAVAAAAGIGIYGIARIGWWLHTWADREARRWLARWRSDPGREEDES